MKLISVKNAEYQIIQALKTNRVKRSQTHEVFVEGIESIKQLLNANIEVTRVIIHDEKELSDWGKSLIAKNKSKSIQMRFDLYKELCDREEPSEVLVTAKINPISLADLSLPEKPFILIFDRPSDYGNFGSILRSANSFNVDAIFVIGHGIDVYDPKVIRASLGGIFHAKIVHIESMKTLEAWIKTQKGKNNLQVIGTDSTGSVSLPDYKLEKPIALVLGNEAKGMSVALKNLCDVIVSIPISGNVNSLNVANAASIFMWEVYKNESGSE
ncbi:MAG TPA: RNA methyltransferase [Anaerolineae bacterium]|nr:RNA methyltransferase [Flavobacterium sp.]HCK66152.1 RNA methyltransferase [Anaerolineae bacterium]